MALSDSFVKREFTPIEEKSNLEQERANAYLEEAGLAGHEVDKLQATMLSPDEAVAAKQEQMTSVRQLRGRKEHWDEFVDMKRRMGLVLHHSEVIRRFRMMIPNLIVARGGQKNRIGLYTTRNMPTDKIKDYRGSRKFIDCPIYLGWLDEGFLPEYEIDLVDEVGVAIGQRRGYRTLLLRMVARRYRCDRCSQGERALPLPCRWSVKDCGAPTSVIGERLVEKFFGHPTNGLTASWYRRSLYEFRNGR